MVMNSKNKNEKKIKKNLEQYNLEKIDDIKFIRIKKNNGTDFIIKCPETFLNCKNKNFVIFGEAKLDVN
ncbi:hypothetical protein (nucleomorph) [Guillardia theta]|uniref:Nascent polypeptide-associated complex subunit beta n=1 Tax=Guillardia theta TaxID=55529 RepID=Q98RX3_GUITH|nr:hypothetical protein GTHECHR1035 [Guillardia theta]AAK39827.1 hypothetical protein [Guillardia theta]